VIPGFKPSRRSREQSIVSRPIAVVPEDGKLGDDDDEEEDNGIQLVDPVAAHTMEKREREFSTP
jgi:hypothetical protein